MFILRNYQTNGVEVMLKQSTGKHGLVLPPGSGKTVMMANYIKQMEDCSILILVHREELVAQTVSKLTAYGIKSGIEKGDLKANPGEIKRLTEKLENRKRRYEARIEDQTDVLAKIPEYQREVEELLRKKNKENNILEARLHKEVDELRLLYSPNSTEFKLNKEAITKKFQREKAATWRINKALVKVIPEKVIASKGAINWNKRKLEELKSFNPEPASVVIASVQSMYEDRLAIWPKDSFDVVIFDEAHHLSAPTWKAISTYFDEAIQFGFSATWNPRENNFNLLFKKEIIEMIEEGWLVKPNYQKIDLRDAEVQPDSPEHDEIILGILKENSAEKAIVFCASVEQSDRLQPLVEKSYSLTSGVPEKERRKAVKDFKDGKLKVLLNYLIVYEGFDDPGATMIIAKMTSDDNVYMQASGRGFRPNQWKSTVKIVDIIVRDGQSTLPTVFGLHKDWEFEDEPFEDAKKAIAYAKEHNLILKLFPNWGFLKLKKVPENYRKVRRANTPYKKVLGDTIKMTSHGSKYAKGVFYGGSNFYSPQASLNLALRERIKHELGFKPVVKIDPSTIPDNQVQLSPEALKKARAASYIKAHWKYNDFLNKMRYWMLKKPLTEAQCNMAISIGEELEKGLSEL